MTDFPFAERREALEKASLARDTERRRVEAQRGRLARELELAFRQYLGTAGIHVHQAVTREYGFTFNANAFSLKVDVQPDLTFSYEDATPYNTAPEHQRRRKSLTADDLTDALLQIVHKDLYGEPPDSAR